MANSAQKAELDLFRHLPPVGKRQTDQDMDVTERKEDDKPNRRQKVTGTWPERQGRRGQRRQREGRTQGQGRQVDQDQMQQLIEATADLSLRVAEAQQLVLLDCGFTWFVATEQGSILHVMFNISKEWRRLQENSPEQITKPLYITMMECILTELKARVARTIQGPALKTAAVTAGLCAAENQWPFKQWSPTQKALIDSGKQPLNTDAIMSMLVSMLADVLEAGVLRKFHASRPLQEDMAGDNKEVCFTMHGAAKHTHML